MLYKNDGYLDTTAYQAMKNIKEEKKIVSICNPRKADIEIYTLKAKRYGRYAMTKRQAPIIPNLYTPSYGGCST